MDNHYITLGLTQRATPEQIRRAYRILARRYHPDVNPDASTSNSPESSNKTSDQNHDSGEKFRKVAEAYRVLSDADQRKKYDDLLNYEGVRAQAFQAYEKAKNAYRPKNMGKETSKPSAKTTPPPRRTAKNSLDIKAGSVWQTLKGTFSKKKSASPNAPSSISIVEVSVTFEESIFGCTKKILVPNQAVPVSVTIPKGTRDGAFVRASDSIKNEYVCLVRVGKHLRLSLQSRGLIAELPVTVREALLGAILTAPGVNEENQITIVPGTQTGAEIRLDSRGIELENGIRGDLIYRILVTIPTCHQAVGIADAVDALERYREEAPRQGFGPRLLSVV